MCIRDRPGGIPGPDGGPPPAPPRRDLPARRPDPYASISGDARGHRERTPQSGPGRGGPAEPAGDRRADRGPRGRAAVRPPPPARDRAVAREPAHRRGAVSYTHLRAHETVLDLVCRLLLEKKKKN